MTDRRVIFDAVRGIVGRGFTTPEIASLDQAIDRYDGKPSASPVVQIGLLGLDFHAAATALKASAEQIHAVWEVESGGGWFQDVRADILSLDGPGGFIDGPNLPKILFEAHIFSRQTKGRFDESHPNLSSRTWNRALYIGGEGEWARLYKAMKLDEKAALMSASVGGAQIMGFNFKLAGFDTVEAFWAAMKVSEKSHLDAFCAFIKNSNLAPALRQINAAAENCRPFAKGYNGAGYEANGYHLKIAKAFQKWTIKKG